MRFMTGDPEVPVLVRLTRNLLAVEAAIFFFGLALYGLTALLTSTGNSATTTASLSPGGEVILMAIGMVVFGFSAWLVGKVDPLGRWVALGLQVVWFGALVVPNVASNPVGETIPILLGGAIAALLFTPDVVRAFDAAAAAGGAVTVAPPAGAAAAAPGDTSTAETAAAGSDTPSATGDEAAGSGEADPSHGAAEEPPAS